MKKEPAMEAHKKIAESITAIWENKDFKLLQNILSSNVKWYESPFTQPLTSIGDVVQQWQSDLAEQKDIDVLTEVLVIDGFAGIYHFSANWRDLSGSHELDGIFRVALSDEGKIASFCQWWSEK
jgi:hypothetical protein